MGKRAQRIIAVILFAMAVGIRSQQLFEPWVGQHNGWGGAMYGNIARNYLKYGYLNTKLGPVANAGKMPLDKVDYYYHYPLLLVWLVSISYHVFGVHEWSARLIPLLFSLLSMWLLFLFARRFFSFGAALLALFFSAVMPIENYYGAHVDVYGSMAVFFTLLAVYGYARWLESSRNSDLILCNLGIILGCLTSWYTYFLPPLILAHYYFLYFRPGKSRHYRLITVAAGASAVFALFLLHRKLLLVTGQQEVHGTLLQKLLIRTSFSIVDPETGITYGPVVIYKRHIKDFISMYSLPLLFLTGAWLALFAGRVWKKRTDHSDWLIFLLLGYGFLHNLAFPSLLPGHDYMSVCYSPGIALAASVIILQAYRYLETAWGAQLGKAAVTAALLLVGLMGLYKSQSLYYWEDLDYPRRLKVWGEMIRNISHDTDVILVPMREDRIFQYYSEREMAFEITTMEKVDKQTAAPNTATLLVCPAKRVAEFQGVLAPLGTKYPGRTEQGLVLYTLEGARQSYLQAR